MKSKLFKVLFFALSFSSSAVFALNPPDQANNPATAHRQMEPAHQSKDGAVLAWLIAVDNNEIAAAKVALQKPSSPAVKQYAYMLERDHGKNLVETIRLSRKLRVSPVETAAVILLKRNGQHEIATLRPLGNREFQIVFINDMVKGHAAALMKLNQDIKETQNPELKAHLEATRRTVIAHLQKGKMLQKQLQPIIMR